MDSLNISSSVDLSYISDAIVNTISGDNLDYVITEDIPYKTGKRYFFQFKSREELCADDVAELIGSWIIDFYEPKLLSQMLKNDFAEDINDRQKILKSAAKKNSLSEKNCNKKYIVRKVSKYLNDENNLYIDGFVRFRLCEYRNQLYMLLCEAVEEFYIEKEYEEFIELLGVYIDDRVPMVDLLHIRANPDGSFSFYDFRQSSIAFSIEEDSTSQLFRNFLTEEDKLISILITLAPKRIIWHETENNKNQNIIKTVREIFKDRFSLCHGCELCKTE